MIFWNQVVEKVPRYIGNNLGAKGSNKYRERTGRSGNQNSIHPIALRPAARTAGSSSRLVWRCAELSSIFAIRSDLVWTHLGDLLGGWKLPIGESIQVTLKLVIKSMTLDVKIFVNHLQLATNPPQMFSWNGSVQIIRGRVNYWMMIQIPGTPKTIKRLHRLGFHRFSPNTICFK